MKHNLTIPSKLVQYLKQTMLLLIIIISASTVQLCAQSEIIYEQLDRNVLRGLPNGAELGNSISLGANNRIVSEVQLFLGLFDGATDINLNLKFWDSCPSPFPNEPSGPGSVCGHNATLICSTDLVGTMSTQTFIPVIFILGAPLDLTGYDDVWVTIGDNLNTGSTQVGWGDGQPTIGTRNSDYLSLCGIQTTGHTNVCVGDSGGNNDLYLKLTALPSPCKDAMIELSPYAPGSAYLADTDFYIGDANYRSISEYNISSSSTNSNNLNCKDLGIHDVTLEFSYPNASGTTTCQSKITIVESATGCTCQSNDTDLDGLCNDVDPCPDAKNNALFFSSNWVEVPHSPDFTLVDGDFAFEAWINLQDDEYNTIVTKGAGGSNTEYIFNVVSDANPNLQNDGNNNYYQIRNCLGLFLTNGPSGEWQYGRTPITQNVWTHVAVSVDNSGANPKATFYVNGVADPSRTFALPKSSLYVDSNPFYIGKQGYAVNNRFEGMMDNLAVWDRSLTAVDISTSMQTPYAGTESGLVAYYNFNQGAACSNNTGQTTLPHVNGSHDGTLHEFDLAYSCVSNWTSGKSIGDCLPAICLEDLNLTAPLAQSEHHEAAEIITSSQVIAAPAVVDYDAGIEIDMLAGFEVNLGVSFHAYIDGCALTSYADLIGSGLTQADAVALGLSLTDLLAAGVTVQDLLIAGYTVADLLAAGVSTSSLIGLTHGGGLIFYVDASTGYTLIVAPSDQSAGAIWGCTDLGTYDFTFGDGQTNTAEIISDGCYEPGIAADICDKLVLNGYDDWFLPSFHELIEIEEIGSGANLANGEYWSSSTYLFGVSKARTYDFFGNNPLYYWSKSDLRRVRAVRAITSLQFYLNNGASVQELLSLCFSIQELLAAGFSVQDLWDAGVGESDFFNVGYSLQDLLDGGISVEDLLAGGVDSNDLIGLIAGGGIIFYINESTGYTLVAAPLDQGMAQWGCSGTVITGADGRVIGTGLQNTLDIEAGCSAAGIAAGLCANLVLDGYNDWFLPSKDEIVEMYLRIGQGASAPNTNIGNFTDVVSYWSSTEGSVGTTAWAHNFNNASGVTNARTWNFKVRAVRELD